MPMIPRPPFDLECEAALSQLTVRLPSPITVDMIPAIREGSAALFPSVESSIGDRPVETEHRTIPGPGGAPALEISILYPRGVSSAAPVVYYIHGGGMFLGNRFLGAEQLAGWVDALGVVVVTVEYRLAPENPDPAPVEDCYAGLVWTAANAAEIGIDATRLVIVGESAGGGLAAGTALLARDRGGPALAAQMLIAPMLDDRTNTFSCEQFDGVGLWDKRSNLFGWTTLLGERRGTESVSHYAAPARADDLSGLPPAFIDVSSTEMLRDESVAYAAKMWAAGTQAELHVWPGGFHSLAPTARISIEARAARTAWLRRILDRKLPGLSHERPRTRSGPGQVP